jgi:uncharacterized protein (UPF0332 family)
MPFEWAHFLDIAKYLFNQAHENAIIQTNAAYRSAISRAYYAAFGHAKVFAMDVMGFAPTGNEDDHLLLRDHFKDNQMPEIARKLHQLRQWRNQSDYENPSYVINENQTKIAIQQAETIIQSLN